MTTRDESSAGMEEWVTPFTRPAVGAAQASFGARVPAAFLPLPWAAASGHRSYGEVDATSGERASADELEEGEMVELAPEETELEAVEELGEDTELDQAELEPEAVETEDESWTTELEEAEDQAWAGEVEQTEAERDELEAGDEEAFEDPVGETDWVESEAAELQDEEAPFDPEVMDWYAGVEAEPEEESGELDEADTEATEEEAGSAEDTERLGWDEEWEEDEAAPAVGVASPLRAGTATIAQLPLLRRHAGIGPDLILKWNDMPGLPSAVDVVVHLHGYSLRPSARLHIERDLLARSGLDWSDPTGADSTPGRTRPTLLLLPRGHFFGGKSGRAYTFPALIASGGLRQLVEFGLRELARRLGLPNLALDRLILTAHSGGAAALLRMVKEVNPHEVHVFDGLYQSAARLIDWVSSRIRRDHSALGAAGLPDEYMGSRGGALRVLFRAGTARYSGDVAAALDRLLPPGSPFRPWYRVEGTATDHLRIPPVYGWRLLANAAANLPGVAFPRAKAAARREGPAQPFDTEATTGGSLRSRIAEVALAEWRQWGQGAKKETEPAMTPVLQRYYRAGVGRDVSARDLQDASWQYNHPWSAVFISYVMRSAGAGDSFTYASAHTTYACAAKKARAGGDQARFWAYRITEARPEVGDLVCKDRKVKTRCAGTTYESLCSGSKSHCDVVIEVDRSRNRIRTVGGNVNQSVDDKEIALDPAGYLPEKAGDGCRWIAVIKPPGAAAPVVASGAGFLDAFATLPARLADAVRQGAIGLQVALAIVSGQRDEKTLTNAVFYARHPELPAGYKIGPGERHLVEEWLKIRDTVIRPLLRALGPAGSSPSVGGGKPSPAGPAARPAPTAPLTPAPATGGDRAYEHHSKLGGYSRSGGGRLETVLRGLRDQGKLSISDGDIELLQRISHVETGGCLQALNSWDDAYMSIGFMQWPLAFGKLQRLIARASEAFRRYGIELDPTRTYSIKRSYGTETPIALKGVSHPSELRSLEWAKRFYAAGLDPEIVAREAELALEIIAEERRKIEKNLGRTIPHYGESSALRALIQETNNHRPAWLRTLLKRAVARYTSSGASTADQFLAMVRDAVREVYPEMARAAAKKRTSDPKKIEEAVARMIRSGNNLITKTATLRMSGRCAA